MFCADTDLFFIFLNPIFESFYFFRGGENNNSRLTVSVSGQVMRFGPSEKLLLHVLCVTLNLRESPPHLQC